MSNRYIDGTLVVAKLSRSILGGAVYKDVTVRSVDGRDEKVGNLMVLNDLKPVMVPGTRGRFYVYDIGGSKGIHGFRSPDGDAYAAFPRRWERMCALMAVLNLIMFTGWLLMDGEVAYWSSFFGVVLGTFAVVSFLERRASMAAFRADNQAVRGPAAGQPART